MGESKSKSLPKISSNKGSEDELDSEDEDDDEEQEEEIWKVSFLYIDAIRC